MEFVRDFLFSECDEEYKVFASSLLPNTKNILGVRLPKLRKFAKNIYKNYNWADFLTRKCEYFEETMLQGMIIGFIEEPIEYVRDYVSKINNWSICDSFCVGLKSAKSNQQKFWGFLQGYFESDNEFELRFAYVMLLNYFINDNYIDKVLILIDKFKNKKYYSQMAVAWALSVCYVKYPEKTFAYLNKSNLQDWVYNKSIQKICESNLVKDDMKAELKQLRRKSV